MTCSLCDGKLEITVFAGQTCPHCDGRGEYPYESGGGRMEIAPCSTCNGKGKIDANGTTTCWWCVQGY